MPYKARDRRVTALWSALLGPTHSASSGLTPIPETTRNQSHLPASLPLYPCSIFPPELYWLLRLYQPITERSPSLTRRDFFLSFSGTLRGHSQVSFYHRRGREKRILAGVIAGRVLAFRCSLYGSRPSMQGSWRWFLEEATAAASLTAAIWLKELQSPTPGDSSWGLPLGVWEERAHPGLPWEAQPWAWEVLPLLPDSSRPLPEAPFSFPTSTSSSPAISSTWTALPLLNTHSFICLPKTNWVLSFALPPYNRHKEDTSPALRNLID